MQKSTSIRPPYGRLRRRYLLLALSIAAAALLLYHPHSTAVFSSADPTTAPYYAGIEGEHIAIYARGQSTPTLETDISIDSLPEADQQALQHGIALSSREALARFLEDYGS